MSNKSHPTYWDRMSAAEGRLLDYYRRNHSNRYGMLAFNKAQDLNYAYHEYWNPALREK